MIKHAQIVNNKAVPEPPPGDTGSPRVLRQDDGAQVLLIRRLRAVPPVCALDRKRRAVLPAFAKIRRLSVTATCYRRLVSRIYSSENLSSSSEADAVCRPCHLMSFVYWRAARPR